MEPGPREARVVPVARVASYLESLVALAVMEPQPQRQGRPVLTSWAVEEQAVVE